MSESNRPIKLFPPLLKVVDSTVQQIKNKQLSIDKTLQPILKNKQYGSRDRKFIIAQVYDIIRYDLYFTEMLKQKKLPTHTCYKVLLNLSRLDIKVINPSLVTKDEALEISWADLNTNSTFEAKTVQSFPKWFWDYGEAEYGKEWEAIAEGLNAPAKTYLRTNTLVNSKEKLRSDFEKEQISAEPIENTDAFLLTENQNLKHHKLYRKGHFEIQDLASQQVSHLANIKESTIVADICAGAGGKTLHVAALMNNKGQVLATDFEASRLKQLKFRMQRAKAKNIEIVPFDKLNTYEENIDTLIIDAPCSASGTIRRKPEIKYNLSIKQLQNYISIQEKLLEEQNLLVKIGGTLVYATCSVFKSESEKQIESFLQNHSNFELQKEKRFLPHIDDTDGFYIAILKRIT